MAEDWCGFLEFANKLSTEKGPAELRSAISRAYYSAFNIALDFATKTDSAFNPRGSEVHARLWEWFGNRKSRVAARVKSEGRAGRDKRNDADYRTAVSFDLAKEAENAVKRARTIIALVKDPNI